MVDEKNGINPGFAVLHTQSDLLWRFGQFSLSSELVRVRCRPFPPFRLLLHGALTLAELSYRACRLSRCPDTALADVDQPNNSTPSQHA